MTDRLAQALDRTFAVVDALTDGELTFGVLRERSGNLPAPTFSRLLKALVAGGVLRAGANGYRLGDRYLRSARSVVGALSAGDILKDTLRTLAERTGESAAYYACRADRMVLVCTHIMPDSATYMPVGGIVPEWSRHGFAMAAGLYATPAELKSMWQRCPRRKERSLSWFRQQLTEARRDGAVCESGEHHPGILRVVAPVGKNPVGGTIGVSTPRNEDRYAHSLIPAVVAAAAEATRLLTAAVS